MGVKTITGYIKRAYITMNRSIILAICWYINSYRYSFVRTSRPCMLNAVFEQDFSICGGEFQKDDTE